MRMRSIAHFRPLLVPRPSVLRKGACHSAVQEDFLSEANKLRVTAITAEMKLLAVVLSTLFVFALVQPSVGTTGTLGLEGGIIAAIIICIASLIAVGSGIGVCLYRNDLCPFCQKTPGALV